MASPRHVTDIPAPAVERRVTEDLEGYRDMDIDAVARLYQEEGPFATVYVAAESAVENARDRVRLHWKDAMRQLRELGVADPCLDTMTAAFGARRRNTGTHVMVARLGEGRGGCDVVLDEELPDFPDTDDLVSVGELPRLAPVVAWANARVPHVVALVDRLGADVFAYLGDPKPVRVDRVDATPPPWHKRGGGGWAARNYLNEVEQDWKTGAKHSAELVADAVAEVHAKVMVVAGDDQAIRLVRDRLPDEVARIMVRTRGGRSVDGSASLVAERVHDVVEDQLRMETEDLLDRFQAAAPADSLAATVAALRQAQVDTLLVAADDPAAAERVFFGPSPMVALGDDELRGVGVTQPRPARAEDAALRAAFATGAQVRMVPSEDPRAPREGLGAILRFS
jgi:hypothetical protein